LDQDIAADFHGLVTEIFVRVFRFCASLFVIEKCVKTFWRVLYFLAIEEVWLEKLLILIQGCILMQEFTIVVNHGIKLIFLIAWKLW
jgi:hypothetical protein